MISLHKWYPFVYPKEYDIKAMAFQRRIEKLEIEYELEVKAQKIRESIEAHALELYDKRARQTTLEIEMFANHKRFDKFV